MSDNNIMPNYNKIILLAGRARSGKDTVATMMFHELMSFGYDKISIVHFADKLKKLSYKVLNEFQPDLSKSAFEEDKDKYNEFLKTNNRKFLQYLGTYGRDVIGENVWASALNIRNGINIVPDHRFENERSVLAEMYPEFDVLSIRVFREQIDNSITPDNHASEKIAFKCDIDIHNNGSLDDLDKFVHDKIIPRIIEHS